MPETTVPYEKKSPFANHELNDLERTILNPTPLKTIVEELGTVLQKPASPDTRYVRALNPPRIMRAIIDYKAKNPRDENIDWLIAFSTELALKVYGNAEDTLGYYDRFVNLLHQPEQQNLLAGVVSQKADAISWEAYDPTYSQATAERMNMDMQACKSKDVLFITLAHGGIPAGLDVFLRYMELSDSQQSVFYPVRYSRVKHKDALPQIEDHELKILSQLAQDRQVVIFDEDKSTGTTLGKAEIDIMTKLKLFDSRKALVYANLNLDGEKVNKIIRVVNSSILTVSSENALKKIELPNLYLKNLENKIKY